LETNKEALSDKRFFIFNRPTPVQDMFNNNLRKPLRIVVNMKISANFVNWKMHVALQPQNCPTDQPESTRNNTLTNL